MGSAHDIVYIVDNLDLFSAGEERLQHYDFVKNAPDSPHVRLVKSLYLAVVEPVREEHFRRAVPPGRDVLCVGHFGENPFAAPEVRDLDFFVSSNQDVFPAIRPNLRLNVSVEDAALVHVVQALQDFVYYVLALEKRQLQVFL